ncbi:MAG: 50S ribosomal protein L11 methyltransferase [Actinomycetota bacterium]
MQQDAPRADIQWTGRTGPFGLALTPNVFAPSRTSQVLAEALEVNPGEVVIDVGCGSGVLSLVAARLSADRVYGCDVSEEAVAAARENARRLGLEDRTEFRVGNLLEPVSEVQADVVIGDVSGIPDSVAEITGWFPEGRGGGPTGAELPVAMLEGMGECLKHGGRLYLPTGTIQAEGLVLDTARRVFGPNNMEIVAEREFPLPNLVARSRSVARLVSEGLLNLSLRGSRLLWRLAIWRCIRA